ncbi:CHAT domain-containing protein [Allorhizocola rhizosphaerae]|uniref:CHAT domain-containing protein n=1 Tax=Allorhizocola rhizosphaerae TaxID=1872709 RepID=UPI000E3DD294|nr:CHAT domain-containing protein [Allorhizocola rhizosphaerae]
MTQRPGADPLGAAIERTTSMLRKMPAQCSVVWRFARCWLLINRYEHGGAVTADLEEAYQEFRRLPEDAPGRERLAAEIVGAQLRRGVVNREDLLERNKLLAAIADRDPHPTGEWRATAAVVRAYDLTFAAINATPGFDLEGARAELEGLAGLTAGFEPQATVFEAARFGLTGLKTVERGDARELSEQGRQVRVLVERLNAQGIGNANFEVFESMAGMIDRLDHHDVDAATGLYERGQQLAGMIPAGHPARAMLADALGQMEKLLPQIAPDWVPSEPPAPPPPPVTLAPPGADSSPLGRASQLSIAALQRLMAVDGSAVGQTQAIDDLARAVELSAGTPLQAMYLLTLACGLLARYEAAHRREDLKQATSLLERARAETGSELDLIWTLCANPLAHAYRLAGRRELGRRTALEGLRGHAWNTLLQQSTMMNDFMLSSAPADAVDVARWCLSDGDSGGAAAALDAGRAQRLYAAIEWRDVEDRLRSVGQSALAQRWRDASRGNPMGAPMELRREVMNVLIGRSGESRAMTSAQILDPPTPHEIRAALTRLGLDALVYLMAGDAAFGAAVVVPAQEPITHVILPDLNSAMVRQMDARIAAVSRELADAGERGRRGLRDLAAESESRLETVCRWAWSGAIGPMLNRHLSLPEGRPLRLALIPMDELTRIPWHAAMREAGGRREYAIDKISFSYAPSARLLCETAWRTAVPIDDRGLVVADPNTGGLAPDLPAARAEARAIRESFYPRARLLGREPDGTDCADGEGTMGQVTSWFTDPDAGTMTHLAVHGEALGPGKRAARPDASSYLLLAGAPPGRFSAEQVIGTLTQPGNRDIALAVLAGCRTGESTEGWDEAFSIGTALLASGVRTVISSQWSVPDNPTSIMMYLFHHYLRSEGLAPGVALREAQLAMIEGRLPDSLPESLRAHAGALETAEIVNWAGFFHSGH